MLPNNRCYSFTEPGTRSVLASRENPLVPSGPLGCRKTVNLGPASSMDIVRRRLINLSGLALTSL